MQQKKLLNATVIVAALGYFVDIFDLVLFGMVRIPSLKTLGITDSIALKDLGLLLDNYQMAGMLLGGIFWGILGDKKGRLTVLFGSIITYSIANIANGFVESVGMYAVLRFIAGFGLAGELGAGITLVNEVMVKEKRGLATAFVAATGIFGAVIGAFLVGGIESLTETLHITAFESWRIVYFVGGGLGVLLLILRISVVESGMYKNAQKDRKNLGNIKILFQNKDLFIRYISIIIIAIPIWYVVQLYAKYAPELGEAVGLEFDDRSSVARYAILFCYLGLTFGDVASGILSNYMKSRRKALRLFLGMMVGSMGLFWLVGIHHVYLFYGTICLIGFAAGYWAVFMSTAAESFGTNIRSTVTNTAPNFVRGSVIGINALYYFFSTYLDLGVLSATIIIGILVLSAAFWALTNIKETFTSDLDYIEE